MAQHEHKEWYNARNARAVYSAVLSATNHERLKANVCRRKKIYIAFSSGNVEKMESIMTMRVQRVVYIARSASKKSKYSVSLRGSEGG